MKNAFQVGLCVGVTLLSAIGLTNCGGSADGFGAPNIGAIVDSSVPTNMKTAAYQIKKDTLIERLFGFQNAYATNSTCSSANNVSTGCGTASNYVDFLRSEVFNKVTGVAATQYYRYWIDVLDNAMTETDARITSNSSQPACMSQTPVSVDFAVNINGQAITITSKLQCFEEQSAPSPATQNMAFGKDSEYFYLVYRTSDNATSSGSGDRIVIGKASLDGNSAEVWFLGTSYQSSSRRGNAQRVLANKSNGKFTFNSVEAATVAGSMLFGSFYGNTDGTYAYMEAAYGNGGTATDVTGMSRASPFCSALSALTTSVSASNCTSLNTSNMPSNFGLTLPMSNTASTKWQADTTAETNYQNAIDTIKNVSYATAGVGQLTF